MANDSDIANYFNFEIWSPQGLPQDAYTGAALYQAPAYLPWTVLETNLSISHQPVNDQNFIMVPFVQGSGDHSEFSRRWGEIMLMKHVRDHFRSNNYVSTHDQLLVEVNRVSSTKDKLKILTFSDEVRTDVENRISKNLGPVFAGTIEYPCFEPRPDIDVNTVLVFTTLGRIVCGVSYCGLGIALCNWGISVLKLPPIPKTRYTRVLEGQVI